MEDTSFFALYFKQFCFWRRIHTKQKSGEKSFVCSRTKIETTLYRTQTVQMKGLFPMCLSLKYAKQVKCAKNHILRAIICSVHISALNARNHKNTPLIPFCALRVHLVLLAFLNSSDNTVFKVDISII